MSGALIFVLALEVVAVVLVFAGVKTVSQGTNWTNERFGRNTNGEKMGPFRVDQGPKTFRGLAAHEHTLRVRK